MAGTWSIKRYHLDCDLLWHMKIGEDMLESGKIFFENTYTWLSNTYWSQQEWLFDIFLYFIVSLTGIIGFYAIHLIPQFTLIFASIKKNKYHYSFLAVVFFFLLATKLSFNNANRPQEFSSYFFILLMFLYNKTYTFKPIIYFSIGVFISNFHCGASVPMLVMICLLFALDILFSVVLKDQTPIKYRIRFFLQYVCCIFAFVAGLLVNPYGPMQFIDMARVKSMNAAAYINEWKSYASSDYMIWIMLLLIVCGFGYGVKKHNFDKSSLIELSILLAFLVLSFVSVKGIIIFFYLFVAYGYKYIDEMIYDCVNQTRLRFPKYQLQYRRFMFYVCFFISLSFAMLVAVYNQESIDHLINSKKEYYASDSVIKELRRISDRHDDFRLLNGYVTGNYLLYYDIPVFIDTREFPYAKEFGYSTAVDDFFETDIYDFNKLDEFFHKYKFNYVLCTPEYDVSLYLENRDDWEIIYSDDENNMSIWGLVK